MVFAVILLIFKGALITSHNAGLAVPDWPTTFGENMFLYPYRSWIGGIFFEHGHRVLASGIGFLTVILALWLWVAPPRPFLKLLGLCALVMVCIQGTLGGLTVIYKLPDAISVAHGILGQTFLLVIVSIAFFTSYARNNSATFTLGGTLLRTGMIATVALYLQLLLGALTRHGEAGLAVTDFPSMGGVYLPTFSVEMLTKINELRAQKLLPPASEYQVAVHLLHRFGAILVSGVLLYFAAVAIRVSLINVRLFKPALGILALVLTQVVLGIATVVSVRQPYITSLHVLVGALLLANTWWLTLAGGIIERSNLPTPE